MTELKPCPFCGGKAHTLKNNAGHYAYCTKCLNGTSYYGTRELAIKAWNTRPDSWHTGTPTEEIKENDWYTFVYKCHGEIRYITIKEPSFWYFTNCDTLAWQKVEPYKEKECIAYHHQTK